MERIRDRNACFDAEGDRPQDLRKGSGGKDEGKNGDSFEETHHVSETLQNDVYSGYDFQFWPEHSVQAGNIESVKLFHYRSRPPNYEPGRWPQKENHDRFHHLSRCFENTDGRPCRFFYERAHYRISRYPQQAAEQFTVIQGTMEHGTTVPLHRHPEVEWIFVLKGTLQVWADSPEQPQWLDVAVGESILVPSNARHAVRNTSGNRVSILLVTATRLGHFFEQIAVPLAPGEPPTPPMPERIRKFLAAQ